MPVALTTSGQWVCDVAFEDGFNRRVTVSRRTTETLWPAVAARVECRIASLKVAEVQALSQQFSQTVSHRLLTSEDEDIRDGDKLTVTEQRLAGGEWEDVESGDEFVVVYVEKAEGGARGPHHLAGALTKATATG